MNSKVAKILVLTLSMLICIQTMQISIFAEDNVSDKATVVASDQEEITNDDVNDTGADDTSVTAANAGGDTAIDETTIGGDDAADENGGDNTDDAASAGSGDEAESNDGSSDKADDDVDAAEHVAKVGDNEYDSLNAAIDAAKDGDTVTLLQDTTDNVDIGSKSLTIDLGGNTLTAGDEDAAAIYASGSSEVTIKNGTITGGHTKAGGAIELREVAESTLSDLTITKNSGGAVFIFHHIDVGATTPDDPCHATITNCNFTYNGSDNKDNANRLNMEAALALHRVSADISKSTFSNNADSLSFLQNLKRNEYIHKVKLNLTDSEFKYNSGEALNIWMSSGNEAVVKSCKIWVNDSGCKNQVIHLQQAELQHFGGGETTFDYCTIQFNESKLYTILAEAGRREFKSCRISRNTAGKAGAIYGTEYCDLQLLNSAINNNHSTSDTAKGASGGVCMRTATIREVGLDVPSTSRQSIAWFTMTSGALYNNTMDIDDGDNDLWVSDTSILDKVVDADEMKDNSNSDGPVDFTGRKWSKRNHGTVLQAGEKTVEDGYVFIDPVNGNDSGIGRREDPVMTWDRAVSLLSEREANAIVVMNTVQFKNTKKPMKAMADVTSQAASESATIDLAGKSILRDDDMKDPLISIENGMSLKIQNTIVDGQYKAASGALVTVDKESSLELSEGAILRNSGNVSKGYSDYGGAVYCKGSLIMDDGSMVSGNYAQGGGGIYIDDGTFKLTGGTIDGNKTQGSSIYAYGGGVLLVNGALMEMSGGTVSNNVAYHSGGGISMGTGVAYDIQKNQDAGIQTARLVMTGGVIDGNTAKSAGGGIFIQCNTSARITKGIISNNRALGMTAAAYFAGGGIYVNGNHSQDYVNGNIDLWNVELSENLAGWEGGAIAWCGTGSGGLGDVQGTVIYDNSSEGNGPENVDVYGPTPYYTDCDVLVDAVAWITDEKGSYVKEDGTYNVEERDVGNTVTVSTHMLNGASYNWKDPDGNPVSDDELISVTGAVRLKTAATATDPDVIASKKEAKVIITGNYSTTNGGGIGCNGEMNMSGEYPPDEPPNDEPPKEDPPKENPPAEVVPPNPNDGPPTEDIVPANPNDGPDNGISNVSTKSVVKTGDGTNVFIYAILLELAVALLAVLFIRKRYRGLWTNGSRS